MRPLNSSSMRRASAVSRRLAQNVAVADDAGVGAEDDQRIIGRIRRAMRIPDRLRLLLRQPLDIGSRGLVGQKVFIEIRGCGKLEARLRKKFAAARRG